MFAVENAIVSTISPLHLVIELREFTWAEGFTVMVNVFGVPKHAFPALVNVGVTSTVATSGKVPELRAVNVVIELVPLEANPIFAFVLVQV